MIALDALSKSSYSGTGNKWYDLSGNLNNVTFTNMPTFNSNGYFTFNGTSNYGVVPDSPSLGINGYNITMEVWLRITSFGTVDGKIHSTQFPISKNPYNGGTSVDAGNYALWVEEDYIVNSSDNGTGQKLKGVGSAGNTSNIWYQMVFIQNQNGYRVLRNGSIMPTVYGDGTQTRSFCYIDDLIEGIIRLMNSDYHLPVNIGNTNEITVNELSNILFQMIKTESRITFLPLPSDDPTNRRPDITLATNILGWEPKVELKNGLEKTIEYIQSDMN